MSSVIKQGKLYKHYPLLSRIEWHLLGFRPFAIGIERAVYKGRFHWHEWRRHRLLGPQSLISFESKVFSQNGEDGILQEIFKRIGNDNKFSIEFGIGDGSECCTRNLLGNQNWRGLLIEGSQTSADNAKSLFKENAGVSVKQSFITVDNILGIFKEYDVPTSPDLLVVDIDGNDYWVLERILAAYRPRVIVCEYNSHWTKGTDWVMPYDPKHQWDGSAYFGASLRALSRLAHKHDYTLVCCESRGVNAFFVRDDQIGDHFPDSHLDLSHYVPPHYGRGYGHQLRFRHDSV